MSKLRSEDEYKKTKAYYFLRWFRGDKDIYEGNVEMHPVVKQDEEAKMPIDVRMAEERKMIENVYDVAHNKEIKIFNVFYRVISVLFCITLMVVLLITVSYLPPLGTAQKPTNNVVSERYIEKGLQETGAVNIVTGMILDYRAFDTFGESNVLFIATCTVFILLRLDHKKEDGKNKKAEAEENDRIYEPKNDAILQVVATILVPVIMIFGIYVILNGHLSPGGGFSGGAIIGAGLILYLNAFGFKKTERFFTEKTYRWICFSSLTFYCLAKSYSFYMGANHLESGIPIGTAGNIISSGLILPLNICVGLVVTCTMYAFYALFRKGGF